MKKDFIATIIKTLLMLLIYFVGIGWFSYSIKSNIFGFLEYRLTYFIYSITYILIGFIFNIKGFRLKFNKQINYLNISLIILFLFLICFPIFIPTAVIGVTYYLFTIEAQIIFSLLLGYVIYVTFFE